MVQRLCNHKTGIHEVTLIVLDFEIPAVSSLFVVINLISTSYLVSIGKRSLVKDLGYFYPVLR